MNENKKIISDYQEQWQRVHGADNIPGFSFVVKNDRVFFSRDVAIVHYGVDMFWKSEMIRMTETLKLRADHPEIPLNEIYANVLADVARAKSSEAVQEKEIDMAYMYAADASDLFRVARHLQKNEIQEAIDHFRSLDTNVRDECPDDVFLFLRETQG